MLRIIEGGFNSGISEIIAKEILARTERGERSLLIVPEQQTVIAEGEACELLPECAPLYFEATNFTRLANSVFRSLGGIAGEYCTPEKKKLIMWRALTELSPMLAMTGGKAEISAGLIERAASAISSAESHGIGADKLAEAERSESIAENARLRAKVSDLSMIMSLYKRLLGEKYQDAADDLTVAAVKLSEHTDYLEKAAIYIDGFTSFTAPQYALIAVLISRAEVTVALNVPKAETATYEFAEPRATEGKLLAIADKLGAQKKLMKVDGCRGVRSEALIEAERLLFRSEGTIDAMPESEALRVIEARDPFDECSFISADIRRRVMDGARFSDFAIIARNAEKYAGILDTALRDYGIPYFASYRRSLSSYEAVKLIHTAYAAVSGGFRREDVITYAKCGLTGIDDEALDELELYCEKWQINGSAFSDGEPWSMNPSGYDERLDAVKLRRINETREALLLPLIAFAEDVREAKTSREHATALVSFLVSLEVEEKLNGRALALAEAGEPNAEDMLKIWGLICEALDAIVSTLGDFAADADSFRMQLRAALGDKSIGSIPSYLDTVTVGSADMIRLKNKKHVYLIGVNAGEFPATVSEDNYFTDRDREALAAAGLSFETETEIKSARELYVFRRSFASASESVTVSYSAASTKQKQLAPSDIVARLLDISDGKVSLARTSELASHALVYTPGSAMLKLSRDGGATSNAIRIALARAGFEKYAAMSELTIVNDSLSLSPEVCGESFGAELALTQSKIDSYVSCPLAYFCKYELKLKDNERAEWNANNIGTFIHAILENFFTAVRDGGMNAGALDEATKRSMTLAAAKRYLAALFPDGDLGSARFKIMLSRLERASMPVVDSLCDEFSDCRFLPRFFELRISRDDPKSPAPVTFSSEDAGRVYVYGTIDRVDTYSRDGDVMVRVIDYKTGTKEFSPSDLAEGKNLQMFLYLKSIIDTASPEFRAELGVSEGGRLIPAGVIYAHTALGDVKMQCEDEALEREAIAKTQRRSGMMLADDDAIAAMNKDYLPVSFDRKGNMKTDRLYSLEDWDKITKTIEESVLRVARGIKGGCAHAPEKQGADKKICGYCEYKAICRNASL